MVQRLVCLGVWFGLSLGEELAELLDWVDAGLDMVFNHGLLVLLLETGVALRLVEEDIEDAVGEGGPREYQLEDSSCKLTMDMVVCKLYCGLAYSEAGVRHGLELCCIFGVIRPRRGLNKLDSLTKRQSGEPHVSG